ncbi:hypothetical protein BO78DRAFT_423071 [Aspergillus sclerotiicarbonarius CBS 121057]|uniref:2EXR domain-containing protein n=1 Tax=Aspergillus sclerotiicarbonarius (strain CBS 121057 / IBT 28362) TaxID=1448318 RepID=A0A319E5Y6_ASPSB|nr:hypothetical protein BO78DRAFT_423071 [Aspergillus sclerotiicarbonarius CBS 121057]
MTLTFNVQSLPPEIRVMIWEATLPEINIYCLYFYEHGYWSSRPLIPGDPDYNPYNPEDRVQARFFHNRPGGLLYFISILFVNRECREIALRWIRRNNLHLRYINGGVMAVRPCNPPSDTLYVPWDQWDEFSHEPAEQTALQLDSAHWFTDGTCRNFTRLALPVEVLERDMNGLAEILSWYSEIESVFVVVNNADLQPNLGPVRIIVELRWELEKVCDARLVWVKDRETFEWWDCRSGDERIVQVMERAGRRLAVTMKDRLVSRFEIQPALAVMKNKYHAW